MTATRSEKRSSDLKKGKEMRPWIEVLRVGELPDDVMRDIEEAKYGVAPSPHPAGKPLG